MSRGAKQQFTEDQLAEFQEAFLLYDNRGDGKISVSLIGDVTRALGQNPTESGEELLPVASSILDGGGPYFENVPQF